MYSFAEVGKRARPDHPGAGAFGARLARAVAPGRADRRPRRRRCSPRPRASAAAASVSGSIAAEVGQLQDELPGAQGQRHRIPAALAAIEPAIDGLQRNLTALDALVASRLAIAAERKEQLLRKLSGTNIATQRLVAPGILVMDSKLAEWRRALADCRASTRTRAAPRPPARRRDHRPSCRSRRRRSSSRRSTTALLKAAAADDAGRPAAARLPAAPLAVHARGAGQRVRRQAAAAPARAGRRVRGSDRRAGQHPRGARGRARRSSPRREALLAENVGCRAQLGDALDRLVGARRSRTSPPPTAKRSRCSGSARAC